MSNRPEYVKCIRRDANKSFCGKDIRGWVWVFVDIEHARGATKSRLVPCEACLATSLDSTRA